MVKPVKNNLPWASNMVQWVKALAFNPDNLSSIPGAQSAKKELNPTSGVPCPLHMYFRHTEAP